MFAKSIGLLERLIWFCTLAFALCLAAQFLLVW
jgi:hypothetical protein